MNAVVCFLLGYLVGTVNPSYLLGRFKGVDIRKKGSGNAGGSNALILFGKTAGVLCSLFDIFKAFLAVWLCRRLFPALPYVGVIAGVCSVLGHIFPFYLHFRGGKGFASYLGMALALDWKFALAIGLVIIIVVLISDYIVAGTMATVVSFPIYNAIRQQYVTALLLAAATLLIIWKHRENLVCICKGTEIGVRSAGKGNYRVK